MNSLILIEIACTLAPSDLITIERHRAVPMRDGVVLYADLYRPQPASRYPTLVVRTPYGVQRDGVHATMIRFAQSGYAVLVQDVRGRYESEGQWDPFRHEADDGYDTIESAAAQPWSNGKVAMQGGSYLGHVQWRAATSAPPHLVTIFPEVAATNIYANWITQGGAFRLSFNYGWGVVRMPNRIMLPQFWHTEAYAPSELQYDTILWHLPLADGDLASAHYEVPHYRTWLAHPSYDEYWKAISDEERFANVHVPVHTIGGWFDIFLAGTINGFVGVRHHGATEQARNGSKMIIGPWGHGNGQQIGDVDFGAAASRDWFAREREWYDHWLRDVDNGIDRAPPVELFYMGLNCWHGESDWPIPGTRFTPYYLADDRQLTTQLPDHTGSDGFAYDPDHPLPTLGGNNCCGTPTVAGPKDQRPLDARPDVLSYTSTSLPAPLAIAGPITMKLHASSDAPDTDFVVKLVDVAADGLAINIAEGILRARYRQGTDRMAMLEPNQVHELDVDLIATANVFLAGHRIRVMITSSHFPQFDRNPNTGDAFALTAATRVAHQTIWRGAQRGSQLVLPVVPIPEAAAVEHR